MKWWIVLALFVLSFGLFGVAWIVAHDKAAASPDTRPTTALVLPPPRNLDSTAVLTVESVGRVRLADDIDHYAQICWKAECVAVRTIFTMENTGRGCFMNQFGQQYFK